MDNTTGMNYDGLVLAGFQGLPLSLGGRMGIGIACVRLFVWLPMKSFFFSGKHDSTF